MASCKTVQNAFSPAPYDATNYNVVSFLSEHAGRDGANFAMGDGSVRYVTAGMPVATLKALASREGDEVANDN